MRNKFDGNIVISELVQHGMRELAPSPSARLDSELLLAHALNCNRAAIYRDANCRTSAEVRQAFVELLGARERGQPIAQILGSQEFWSLPFIVDEHVLIPRPDTEILVESALNLIRPCTNPVIADLGTGSGAIAVVIGLERRDAHVVAIDKSVAALRVAQKNSRIHGATNTHLLRSSWLTALQDSEFDLIASNPPYVADDDPLLSASDIRFEPPQALRAGKDGLEALRNIVSSASRVLKLAGVLLVEHGYNQGEQVRGLFRAHRFTSITTLRDLAGHERVTHGKTGKL